MNYFVTGRKLEANSISYIERNADELLMKAVFKREYTWILSTPQMGKSSLIKNTINKIETLKTFKTTYIDLSLDSDILKEEVFYPKLLSDIYSKFNLRFDNFKYEDKLEVYPGKAHQVFQEYLIDLPLNSDSGLIIFLDEIDSLFRDKIDKVFHINLFSTIRELYNLRGNIAKLGNLTFCLAGVRSPIKLLDDPYLTLYDTIQIKLGYIEREQYSCYELGFTNFNGNKTDLINSIYSWTNGHPYLTQYICKIINDEKNSDIIDNTDIFVYKIIKDYLLNENKAIDDITHLDEIQKYIISDDKVGIRSIELYSRIWSGEKIPYNPLIETQEFLINSGLIINQDQFLIIRNKVYYNYFNDFWIERLLKAINRPFNDIIVSWLERNKNPNDANLKGNSLRKIEIWSKSRDDITQNEMQFIDQCRNNEQLRNKKRNLIVAFTLIFSLLSVMLFVSFQKNKHTHEKLILETKNATQIEDNVSFLRLIQDEKVNPQVLYDSINKYRKKYDGYNELQIEYFKSLLNKTPYTILELEEAISNIEVLSENRFVYSAGNKILYCNDSDIESIMEIDDTINCFHYNETTGVCVASSNSNIVYIIKPFQNLMLHNLTDSIEYIKVLGNKIIIISKHNRISILNNDGDILKQFELDNGILECYSDNSQIYLQCSDSLIYRYEPEIDSIFPVLQNLYPKNGRVFTSFNSNYFAVNKNTSVSYFNLNNSNDTITINYLNRIKDFTISDAMLVALCYDGNFYFHSMKTNNDFVLTCSSGLLDILKFRYNKNKTFEVYNQKGTVLKYNLKFFDFIDKQVDMPEISAAYIDNYFEIIGNFYGQLSIIKQNTQSSIVGHIGGITAIDVSKEFEFIATASFDHSIRIMDFKGQLIDSIVFNNGGILDLEIINNQQKLIVTCENSIVYLWNLKSKRYKSFKGHTNMVNVIDISKESDLFITGSRDSTIIIWNYNSKKELKTRLKEHKGWITDVKISPDSQHFLSSSTDGSIILWDIYGNMIKKYLGHTDEVWNVCWITNNSFVSSSRDNTCCIWDTNGDIKNLFSGNSSHLAEIKYNSITKELHLFFLNGEERIYNI